MSIDITRITTDLQTMIRQPSVSATGEGISECAQLVCDIMNHAGISSRLLPLDGHAPVVYGEVLSKQNPQRTVLFYNHYDVQPAEPLELWTHDPFGGEISDGIVYGRGASDDKGELAARLEAVRACILSGDVPCNVKFLVEGEEENGSEGISEYVRRYGSLLHCDGIVWEFGYVNAALKPVVGLGVKGLMYVELRAQGAGADLHSGMAPIIPNAAWRLVGALSTLAGSDGRIRIPDWYATASPLSEEDHTLIREMSYDADAVRHDVGVDAFVHNQDSLQAKVDLAQVATCNISGMSSGYAGDGTKTIIPCQAIAKLDLRLVPGMDPATQERLLRDHLQSQGYGDIMLRVLHSMPGIRTDPKNMFVKAVRDAADHIYGSHVLSVTYPETGPMWQLSHELEAPCVLVGGTHINSCIHAPDEHARLDLLANTANVMISILEKFSV